MMPLYHIISAKISFSRYHKIIHTVLKAWIFLREDHCIVLFLVFLGEGGKIQADLVLLSLMPVFRLQQKRQRKAVIYDILSKGAAKTVGGQS